MYQRGNVSMCELEVRTSNTGAPGLEKMKEIAEQWLTQYADGDVDRYSKDKYNIANPNGVWGKDRGRKEYWI